MIPSLAGRYVKQSPKFKHSRSPRFDYKEPILPGCVLCSLAAQYDNPFRTQFLAPTDCLKIPAQATKAGGNDSWAPSTFTNSGSDSLPPTLSCVPFQRSQLIVRCSIPIILKTFCIFIRRLPYSMVLSFACEWPSRVWLLLQWREF